MEENDDFQIVDMESHIEAGKQEFSHSVLVMTAVSRCSNFLAREMCEGYWNEKVDKHGNITRFYVNDTRKMFIGAVKSLMYLLDGVDDDRDLKPLQEQIDNIKKEISELKNKYLLMEAKDWETAPRVIRDIRMQQGLRYRAGIFCSKLPYENEYILNLVDLYEQIFVRLIKIAKELNTSMDVEA
jgi:hypothetical protein